MKLEHNEGDIELHTFIIVEITAGSICEEEYWVNHLAIDTKKPINCKFVDLLPLFAVLSSYIYHCRNRISMVHIPKWKLGTDHYYYYYYSILGSMFFSALPSTLLRVFCINSILGSMFFVGSVLLSSSIYYENFLILSYYTNYSLL